MLFALVHKSRGESREVPALPACSQEQGSDEALADDYWQLLSALAHPTSERGCMHPMGIGNHVALRVGHREPPTEEGGRLLQRGLDVVPVVLLLVRI